jgi:hypothetical protein
LRNISLSFLGRRSRQRGRYIVFTIEVNGDGHDDGARRFTIGSVASYPGSSINLVW